MATMRLPHCALLLGLLLAGTACRPADPLDWKVSAKNPQEYNAWAEKNLPQLEPKLRGEYARAFTAIATTSPNRGAARHMREENHAVCRRIHRRTIRAVILEGYGIEKQKILERMAAQTDLLLKNANRSGAPTHSTKTEAKFERVMDAQSTSVEALNRRLTELNTRIAALAPYTQN